MWKESVAMKKFLIAIGICFLLVTTACGGKLTTYTEISYAEYLEKLDNGDTFPLVIGSNNCTACAIFKGTMDTFISDYQVEVFYIDIAEINEEEYNSLKTQISFDGTPTTVFIESGELTSFYNRIDGTASYTKIKEIFTSNHYID